MRNVGMISASLTRKQKLILPLGRTSPPREALQKADEVKKSVLAEQFVPKQMVRLKPATTPEPEPETLVKPVPQSFHIPAVSLKPASLPVPVKSETSPRKEPPALSKYYQINASAPIVEDALLSTIPPAKPPRPKLAAETSAAASSSTSVASPSAASTTAASTASTASTPLEEDSILSTIPKRPAGAKQRFRGLSETKDSLYIKRDILKPTLKLETEPEPPVRTTSFERGRHYSGPSKPKRGITFPAKPVTTSALNKLTGPKIEQPKPIEDFHAVPSLNTSQEIAPKPFKAGRFTVTLDKQDPPAGSIALTLQQDLKGPEKVTYGGSKVEPTVFSSSAVKDRPVLDVKPHVKQYESERFGNVAVVGNTDVADDDSSVDSLEQSDIDYIKNVSKMIAGFIDNEHEEEETNKDPSPVSGHSSSSSPSPGQKKKVRFREGHEEYKLDLTLEREGSQEDAEKGTGDRMDRVGKNLMQDLADYFSTSEATETKVDDISEAANTTTSLQLEDFLSATSSFKTDYEQIDVNELVAKSLTEAGISPEPTMMTSRHMTDDVTMTSHHVTGDVTEHSMVDESDEGFNDYEDKEDEQPSYFDILCGRSSTSEDNVNDEILTPRHI